MPCPELFLLLLLPVSRHELSEAQVVKLQRSRTPRFPLSVLLHLANIVTIIVGTVKQLSAGTMAVYE